MLSRLEQNQVDEDEQGFHGFHLDCGYLMQVPFCSGNGAEHYFRVTRKAGPAV